ncbi:UNKNOWN [Stylonychia lemnae]|uniref:Uncharacterized protein n=1 Tax=Stylonychia lemnae TaxID=5949 RepID=A0A078AP35_STYLE|nr:UNKNOWN [Stylonychia lemnae]|eukprot:CDW82728.1 UNKNOWN [Stylonychia lemnae]
MKKSENNHKPGLQQVPINEYHLPDVRQNYNFKKSFFGRFTKDKKERLNSLVKMYQQSQQAEITKNNGGNNHMSSSIRSKEQHKENIMKTPVQSNKGGIDSVKKHQIQVNEYSSSHKERWNHHINSNHHHSSQTKSDHIEYKKYLQNISIQNIMNQGSPQKIPINKQQKSDRGSLLKPNQNYYKMSQQYNDGFSNATGSTGRNNIVDIDFQHRDYSQVTEFSYSQKQLLNESSAQKENLPSSRSYTRLPILYKENFNQSIKLKNTQNEKPASNYNDMENVKKANGLNSSDFNFTFNPKPLSVYKQAQLREVLKDKTQQILNQVQGKRDSVPSNMISGGGVIEVTNINTLSQKRKQVKKSELIQIAKQVMNRPFLDPKLEVNQIKKKSTQLELISNLNKENHHHSFVNESSDKSEYYNQSSLNALESVRNKLQSELSSPIKYRRRGIKSSPKLPQAFRDKVQAQNQYHQTNPYSYMDEKSFDSNLNIADQSIAMNYRSSNLTPDDNTDDPELLLHQNLIQNLNDMLEVKLFQTPSQDKIQFSSGLQLRANRNQYSLTKGMSNGTNSYQQSYGRKRESDIMVQDSQVKDTGSEKATNHSRPRLKYNQNPDNNIEETVNVIVSQSKEYSLV